MLTIAELKEVIPKQHRTKVSQSFVDTLNTMVKDPQMAEVYQKNIITYSHVLQDGRFKLTDYFNAVLFVSYKMMGLSSMAAYQKVFPDKCRDMVNRNVSAKDMQAYASTFNKNKLVTLIYEQTLIPDHIMYASIRHKAIATQAALLNSANENVAQKAADSLLMHLKAPDTSKIQIDIATKDVGIIEDLSNVLNRLSEVQQQSISSGSANAKQIAHSVLIEGESEEITQLP